jgi:hypothetical protein
VRNNFVYGLLSVVVGAISTLTGYGQLTSLTEGFDTVGSSGPPPTGIFASGWIVINNSSPLGNHTWNQGIPPPQLNTLGANAQSGAPNPFIQTDSNAGLAGLRRDSQRLADHAGPLLTEWGCDFFLHPGQPIEHPVSKRASGLGKPNWFERRKRWFDRSKSRGRFHY